MSSRVSVEPVINAAGKMTALGGSVQSDSVAAAMADAAQTHVDLAKLRSHAGQVIAGLTGAEAACVTSGAAAGLAISIAAVLTGQNLNRVMQVPKLDGNTDILLQTGHAINFGATIEQMIKVGGGNPVLIGQANNVPERLLADLLSTRKFAALVFVQSHHSVQENMLPLSVCIDHCHQHGIPVIVDAAAEEDLQQYISAGADLVTYSGGKAFCGPTSGFISGREDLIIACEMQFRGIARTMKVGKEQITGLLKALDEYQQRIESDYQARLEKMNRLLHDKLISETSLKVSLRADEAGRDFQRVAVSATEGLFEIRDLVTFLTAGNPAIHTRNHHLDQGFIQLDSRELSFSDVDTIINRIQDFVSSLPRANVASS